MTFNDRLYVLLTTDQSPEVHAAIVDRLYPGRLPQPAVMPALTYQQQSTTLPYRTQSGEGPEQARYQITCWDKTPEGADALFDLVRAALKAGGPGIAGIRDGGNPDQDPQTELWRHRVSYLFTYEQ